MPIPLGVLAVAGAGGGGLANSYDLLQTTLITSNTASVNFSSINTLASGYKHLELRATMRNNTSYVLEDLKIQFNGVTGSSYNFHYLNGNGSAVNTGVASSIPNDVIQIRNIAGNTAGSNQFGAMTLSLLDFGSTNKTKTIRAMSGLLVTGSENFSQVELTSGFLNSTNAITSMLLFPASGSFVSGSRFSLYGIK
jgi:hypothetical protein